MDLSTILHFPITRPIREIIFKCWRELVNNSLKSRIRITGMGGNWERGVYYKKARKRSWESSVGNMGGATKAVQRLVFVSCGCRVSSRLHLWRMERIRSVNGAKLACKDKREIVHGKGQNWIASVSVEPRFLDEPAVRSTRPGDDRIRSVRSPLSFLPRRLPSFSMISPGDATVLINSRQSA